MQFCFVNIKLHQSLWEIIFLELLLVLECTNTLAVVYFLTNYIYLEAELKTGRINICMRGSRKFCQRGSNFEGFSLFFVFYFFLFFIYFFFFFLVDETR